MDNAIIQTHELAVYYGHHRGIVDLDLRVERGEVYGFLGPNGAGKTTTMRVLMDIIRPTRGRATVFGLDCRRDGPAIRRRLGYVPGELSLYGYMTGQGFLEMIAGLRGNGADTTYRQALCERLDLDVSRRIGEYSQGNKRKLGLVSAFMSRPELLILDEPTAGLDPLMQRSVHELVREARDEGRTVFFSSHNLPEVQAVCDRVGLIRDGRMVAIEQVSDLIARRTLRLRLTLDKAPADSDFDMDGVDVVMLNGPQIELDIHDGVQGVMEAAVRLGIADIETQPVTLEEVFMTYYGHTGGRDA
jgi:ABC-2 type transport system ATP-binding protein